MHTLVMHAHTLFCTLFDVAAYLLIDMPGQVELYTVDDSIKTILAELSNRDRDARLCAVHLIDSTLCVQPHQYLSALMIALSAQITLEMPFINVFSKVDLIEEDNLSKFFLVSPCSS